MDVNLENSNDDDDDDGKEPDYEGRAIRDKKRVLSFYGGKCIQPPFISPNLFE